MPMRQSCQQKIKLMKVLKRMSFQNPQGLGKGRVLALNLKSGADGTHCADWLLSLCLPGEEFCAEAHWTLSFAQVPRAEQVLTGVLRELSVRSALASRLPKTASRTLAAAPSLEDQLSHYRRVHACSKAA